MKKYIDKLLYFFGYAPIKLSHEIKYINIHRGVGLNVLKDEKKIDLSIYKSEDIFLVKRMTKERIIVDFVNYLEDSILFEEKEENGYYCIKGSVLIKKPEA